MTKTAQLQELHLRAAMGETLTKEEEAILSDWYELLDREEAVINSQNQTTNIESLRKKFDKATAQISVISDDVAQLLKQNEVLRQENIALRRQLESRLAEQAA